MSVKDFRIVNLVSLGYLSSVCASRITFGSSAMCSLCVHASVQLLSWLFPVMCKDISWTSLPGSSCSWGRHDGFMDGVLQAGIPFQGHLLCPTCKLVSVVLSCFFPSLSWLTATLTVQVFHLGFVTLLHISTLHFSVCLLLVVW